MTTATTSAAPLVSIVTPTLNQAAFIEATLVSVMRQTYPSVEHIVVDGGSSDGTQEILERYQDRYNLSWTSGADGGMYEAVNRGMSGAGGAILAYLNSDDLYLPWTIETVVRRLQHYPAVDVVYGDALLLDEATRRARLAFFPPIATEFLQTAFLVQPTVFWRRGAYDAVAGFDEQLRFVGDLDYFIRLGQRCRFAKIDEVLAVERHHAAAKTSAYLPEVLSEARDVRSRYARAKGTTGRLSGVGEWARGWIWRRIYWLEFLLAWKGSLPSGDHWARFIEAANPRVSVARVAIMQLPLLGWRFADDAVMPSREWMDRLAGERELA